jgi:hypothetical protein
MMGAYKECWLLSTAPQGHIFRAKSRTMRRTYPKTIQPVILSLPKGGWRLHKAAPFG